MVRPANDHFKRSICTEIATLKKGKIFSSKYSLYKTNRAYAYILLPNNNNQFKMIEKKSSLRREIYSNKEGNRIDT